MSLTSRIEKDYIEAYKAKDAVKLAVLRLLKTAIKNRQVELCAPPSEADILDLVAKQVKQRRDSIEQYVKAEREDLAAVERAELEELLSYMPQPLSDEELAAAIDEAAKAVDAQGMKDMGRVMQALAEAHKGRYDGKKASELVRKRLSN